MTLTLSLQEDESLRRLGNRFTYRPNTEDERYQEHAGDVCTIIRALTPDEADILITGLMWEAEFPNSANPEEPHILHVFDGELELPEPVQSRKPPLAQQITDAQEKSTFQSQNEERKQPER